MENTLHTAKSARISVPVIALSLYAVASGYLMSLIPLVLPHYGLESQLASWLASVFYAGLLLGAVAIEPLVHRFGHRNAFVICLSAFIATIIILPLVAHASVWLVARFIAGVAVAGVFVVVESWLLHGDERGRARRLGIYMASLYGGSSIGQLGIGYLGVEGHLPFVVIFVLLMLAVMVLMFGKSEQPHSEQPSRLSLKQISKISHAAMLGCMVSGLTIGAVYGLMPLELLHRGIAQDDLGTLMALVILGGMAVQPMVPWASKFLGRTLLMALFCLLGVGAIAITTLDHSLTTLAMAIFVLGMALFSLYPIAINLGCDKMEPSKIVAITQVMLFSYSIGSVVGPLLADGFMHTEQGLMGYLFTTLLATCLYMLIASVKTKRRWVAGK